MILVSVTKPHRVRIIDADDDSALAALVEETLETPTALHTDLPSGLRTTHFPPCVHCTESLAVSDLHTTCGIPQRMGTGVYQMYWRGRSVALTLDPVGLTTVDVLEGDELDWDEECAARDVLEAYIQRQEER